MKRIYPCLIVLCVLMIISCKKDKDDPEPPREYPYYFTGGIDGITVNWPANDSDAIYANEIDQKQNVAGADYDIYEGTVIMDEQSIPSNAIYVHILKHFDHAPSAAERTAMVHTGDYPFGVANLASTIDGAVVSHTDANGNFWSSERGSQTGSTFSITEIVDNPAHNSAKLFKVTFTCKLYNGSNSKQFTSATVRAKILAP